MKDSAVEMIAGAVSAAGIGAAAAILLNLDAELSDVLGLLGALIGAAATVAGAAWLADRTAKEARNAESSILADECKVLKRETDALAAAWTEEYPRPLSWQQALHDLERQAREVPALFREALEHAKALDFRQRVKIRKAEGAVLSFTIVYDDCYSGVELNSFDDRDWPSTLAYMSECLGEAANELSRG